MEIARASQKALILSASNDLPPSRWCKVRLTNGRTIRSFRNYCLADIRGRPAGHPPVERERRGRPILEERQVWVEKGTRELWAIAQLTYREDGERMVSLRPYGCHLPMRRLTEKSLRGMLRVWEDAVRYKEQLSAPTIVEDRVKN